MCKEERFVPAIVSPPTRTGWKQIAKGKKKGRCKRGLESREYRETRSTLCSTILYLGVKIRNGEGVRGGGYCLLLEMLSGGATKNGETRVKTNRYHCTLSIRGYTNRVHLPIFSGRKKIMQFFLFFFSAFLLQQQLN